MPGVDTGLARLSRAEAAAHTASMPLAHVAAALVTYAGVRRASTITAALGRALALAAEALRTRLVVRVRT